MNTNEFNGLAEIKVGMGSSFNSFQLSKEEDKQIEKEINYFERKRQRGGFKTSWCIYEIRLLHLKSPFKGKWLTDGVHNDIKVPLPNRQLTGTDLWKACDQLYTILNNPDHRFIESFEQVDNDKIEVFFGS